MSSETVRDHVRFRSLCPRLARANDERRHELCHVDLDSCKRGEVFWKILQCAYTYGNYPQRCFCGAFRCETRWLQQLILKGPNSGKIAYRTITSCARCGQTRCSSNSPNGFLENVDEMPRFGTFPIEEFCVLVEVSDG